MKAALIEESADAPAELAAYLNCYVAVPPNGKICAVTGLRHAKLYSMLLHGDAARHVRVVSLREPGASRGKLLFHRGDMLRYLDRLAGQQATRHADAQEVA